MSDADININSVQRDAAQVYCPNCGAALAFDADKGVWACEYCASTFSRQELDHEVQGAKLEQEAFNRLLHEYSCPSCGAEIVTDQDTVADFCAYCGNPVILHKEVQGQTKPDLIIPFAIGKDKAQECLKKYLRKKLFIPRSFFDQANLDKIAGIYHPFWEADMETDCCMQAQGTHTTVWVSGNKRFTQVKYYSVWRRGEIHFEDVSSNALASADKQLVEGVLPFPIQSHVNFDMRYMSGFYAKKCTLSKQDVRQDINDKLHLYAKEILRDTVHGYDTLDVKKTAVNIDSAHWDYTLLPIWILNYHYRKKTYTFAVNGVTGKVYGDLPTSRAKVAITAASLMAGITGLITLIGGLLG